MRFIGVGTGDTRIVTRFALLPIRIGRDVRWLEICKIKQEAYDVSYYMFPWHNVKFLN